MGADGFFVIKRGAPTRQCAHMRESGATGVGWRAKPYNALSDRMILAGGEGGARHVIWLANSILWRRSPTTLPALQFTLPPQDFDKTIIIHAFLLFFWT
jgi:hypothetical protein